MKRSKDEAFNGGSSPSEGSDSKQTRTVGGIGSNRELTTIDALKYLDAVRKKFRKEKKKYDEFIEALNAYKTKSIDGDGLVARVNQILKGHPDLLSGFKIFTPAGRQIPISPVEKKRNAKKDGTITSHTDPGLSMERPKSGKGKAIVKENTEQRWLDEEERVKKEDSRDRDLAISEFKENEGQLPRAVKREGRNRNQVREQDNVVKNRDKIGRCSFGKKDGTATLHADPVLSMERPKSGKGKGIVKENTEQRWLDEEERVKKEDSRDREEGDRAISELKENEGQLPRSVKREDRNRNQGREQDNVVKNQDKIGRRSFVKKGARSSRKPKLDLSKLDLSKREQCTPSYRLLPENYRKPIASQRSKLEAEVLNDDLVNVTSGSEDSFKHMRKNPHAKVLFKCEDDMFELDVLIETAKSATKQVEELIAKMKNNRNKMDTPIRLEEHFRAQSLRCIENIYGEHGLEIMDVLMNTPERALPLISTRLKQKQEDWARGRSRFNKIWAEVYAEHHDKSLDHWSSF